MWWPLHLVSIHTAMPFGHQSPVIIIVCCCCTSHACIQRLKQSSRLMRGTFHLGARHPSVRNKGWSCAINGEQSQFATEDYSVVVGNGEQGKGEHDGSSVSAGHLTLVRTTVHSSVVFQDNAVTCLTPHFVETTLFIALFCFTARAVKLLQSFQLLENVCKKSPWILISYKVLAGACHPPWGNVICDGWNGVWLVSLSRLRLDFKKDFPGQGGRSTTGTGCESLLLCPAWDCIERMWKGNTICLSGCLPTLWFCLSPCSF